MAGLRAGDLRRRVTLQRHAAAQDSFGVQSGVWTDVVTTGAAIEQLQGRELEMAQAIAAETTHRITVRYRAGVTPGMRAVYQGRVLNVLSVIDIDTAHIALQLLCSEGLNQG